MRAWLAKLSELFGFTEPEPRTWPHPREFTTLSKRDLLYREKSQYAHECGHAVVAWLSASVHSVKGITFHGDGSAVTKSYFRARHLDTPLERIVVTLGGLAGETLVWERVLARGFGHDLPSARKHSVALLKRTTVAAIERRWAGCLADSTLDVASMMHPKPPADVAAVMNLCYRRAKWLLKENRAGFDRLVALAERQGDLSHEDIASQFGPRLWANLR